MFLLSRKGFNDIHLEFRNARENKILFSIEFPATELNVKAKGGYGQTDLQLTAERGGKDLTMFLTNRHSLSYETDLEHSRFF